jgi:hypothetical protein
MLRDEGTFWLWQITAELSRLAHRQRRYYPRPEAKAGEAGNFNDIGREVANRTQIDLLLSIRRMVERRCLSHIQRQVAAGAATH